MPKKKKIKAKKKTVKKKKSRKVKGPKSLGKITHYFDKISVAIIKTSATLKVGDYIFIHGKGGNNFHQTISSIQINHKNVPQVNRGAEIGIRVEKEVKIGGSIFKAEEIIHAVQDQKQIVQQKTISIKPIFPGMQDKRTAVPSRLKIASSPPPQRKQSSGKTRFLSF